MEIKLCSQKKRLVNMLDYIDMTKHKILPAQNLHPLETMMISESPGEANCTGVIPEQKGASQEGGRCHPQDCPAQVPQISPREC